MALRKPDLDSGGDYSTYELRSLRDAMNEYIRSHAKGHDVMLAAVMSRLEALEAKMVDNTPKGGYDLPYHNEKGKIIYPEGK